VLERLIIWVTTIAAAYTVKKIQRLSYKLYGTTYPVILIAGNVGKSTLTLLVSQLLQHSGLQVLTGTTTQKNYNTPLGILKTLYAADNYPQLLLRILAGQYLHPKQGTHLVFELGVDEHRGASRYTRIFPTIDYLLMAGLGAEHTGGFPNTIDTVRAKQILEQVPQEIVTQLTDIQSIPTKNVILEQLYLIQHAKHIVLPKYIGQLGNEVIAFEDKDTVAHHSAAVILQSNRQYINGALINSRYYIPNTFGVFYSILACLQEQLKLSPNTLTTTLENMQLPNGRFGRFVGKAPYEYVIDSTYNSDPLSLSGFLDSLDTVLLSHPNHTVVLGEMRELGDESHKEHQIVLDRIGALPPTVTCLLVGKEWGKLSSNTIYFDTPGEALKYLQTIQVPDNSWLWCKGSQNTIFLEEIVKAYLADSTDIQYLCRQDSKWLEQKQQYYQ
jgi:Mur ligase middle domain